MLPGTTVLPSIGLTLLYPTLAWNVHCYHIERMLSANGAYARRGNDKNIARLDEMLKTVRTKDVYKSFPFTLCTSDGNPEDRFGAWVLCDSGYHLWRCTICAFKHTNLPKQRCWSRRMDRIRKNVEDTFG